MCTVQAGSFTCWLDRSLWMMVAASICLRAATRRLHVSALTQGMKQAGRALDVCDLDGNGVLRQISHLSPSHARAVMLRRLAGALYIYGARPPLDFAGEMCLLVGLVAFSARRRAAQGQG
jgi:hypothetical protein